MGKSIETVRPPTTPLPTQDSKDKGVTAKECEVSFKGDENVLILTVDLLYNSDYTKSC